MLTSAGSGRTPQDWRTVARRQINLKVLDDGTKTFEVRHRWEDRPVPPPPDGTATEYLPFRQQARGLPGAHGRPEWLKARVPDGEVYRDIKETMRGLNLHTVCEEARCPNIGECWNNRTATFMILGNVCTRSCGFCAVLTGKPTELDLDEPYRVADAAKQMGLEHAVITSVNRDELSDGGATIFAGTIRAIRDAGPWLRRRGSYPRFQGRPRRHPDRHRRPSRYLQPQHRDGPASLPRRQAAGQVQAFVGGAPLRQGDHPRRPDQERVHGGPGRGRGGDPPDHARPARPRGRHPHHRPVPQTLGEPPAR